MLMRLPPSRGTEWSASIKNRATAGCASNRASDVTACQLRMWPDIAGLYMSDCYSEALYKELVIDGLGVDHV